jgi:hypothetical protein
MGDLTGPDLGQRIEAAKLEAEQAAEIKAQSVELVNAQSSAASQEPSGRDVPMQIEFGANSVSPAPTSVTLDANGTLTFNEVGRYLIDISLQFGRMTGAGESIFILYGTVNPTSGTNDEDDFPVGRVFHAELDNNKTSLPIFATNHLVEVSTAGLQLKYWLQRDSAGTNDGGLIQIIPSGTHFGNAIPVSNTAGISVFGIA